MQATRYSGAPNPYEWLAREMRHPGVATSAERLEDRAAALRSRRKADEKADIAHVKDLAIGAKRARRALEVAQGMWQLSPTPANRQAVTDAYAARSEAMAELREALANDDDLVARAISWVS
jgi:hypothetical protein